MKLNELSNNYGAKKDRKRVGRGIGSGKGKTCGRGVKGQKSRSGVAIKGFEGGQTPIIKRLPKRGFNCPSTVKYNVINLIDIEYLLKVGRLTSGEIVTKQKLVEVGLLKSSKLPVKLLSVNSDEFSSDENKLIIASLSFQLDLYSATARKLVEEAGGKIL